MFHNHRINIFIYYILTSISFVAITYYFLEVLKIQNSTLLFIVIFLLIVFAGALIAKLSVDPLLEHITNLQNLSKETLHELNLPISTITTNLQMIKKNLITEKDLTRASRIESACEMLKQRYNELDYMIKLQSANIAYEEFSLDELLRERVGFLSPIYSDMEFELNLKPISIYNDKIGLSKVIDNLIDNGVKYSQNIHKITVTLQGNLLSIQDYGQGMNEVELLKIFDNCYQSNKNMQGFGIGLAMVKRFCDANGILLNFSSQPNTGTTVILQFKEK
ncbi:MAG: two-component system, OmpR family, sensor kinase [Campylobacterota bacterium]|nr:two-component system, OmpR family, sensor kinase [Campylobacterota bacterium]